MVAERKQENLSFNKGDVRAALKLIVEEMQEIWKMTDSQQEDYVDVMTRRIVNLCYTTAQAIRVQSKWTEELPWRSEIREPKKKSAKSASSATSAPAATYMFGFDAELKLAYRLDADSRRPTRDYSMPIQTPEKYTDTQCIEAVWADGMRRQMPEMTITAFLASRRVPATEGQPPMYEKEHSKTHHKITVSEADNIC